MKRKVILIFGIIFILLNLSVCALGAPAYLYPKAYQITIKNVNKDEIKSIELIYPTKYEINYEINDDARLWLNNTDFGYKYKDYTDKEIIPTLTTEQIDDIAMAYNIGDVRDIKGYWLDGSVISEIPQNTITKFAIYENSNVKYNDNEIIVTYLRARESYITSFIRLRIMKNDGTVIYSDNAYIDMVQVIDENTRGERYKIATRVLDKVAYFEVDFCNISNNFDILRKNFFSNLEDYNLMIGYFVILGILEIFGNT